MLHQERYNSCVIVYELIQLPFGVVSGVGTVTGVFDVVQVPQGEEEVMEFLTRSKMAFNKNLLKCNSDFTNKSRLTATLPRGYYCHSDNSVASCVDIQTMLLWLILIFAVFRQSPLTVCFTVCINCSIFTFIVNNNTHTHTTVLRLCGICPGKPG